MGLKRYSTIFFFGLLAITSCAFHPSFTAPHVSLRHFVAINSSTLLSTSSHNPDENNGGLSLNSLEPSIAEQFKIKICSSASCMKRSKAFGLDEYALYSGMYQRKEDNVASAVQIEEGTCMGRCKFGPCIGIEHEDYDGFVGLEGMEPHEMSYRVFEK